MNSQRRTTALHNTEHIMLKKSLIAAALLVPALALSSTAYSQVYQGGPKSAIATRAQTFEVNKPYAQFVQEKAKDNHSYLGGPNGVMPHSQR